MTAEPIPPTTNNVRPDLAALCARLKALAPTLNDVDDWPAEQFRLLADAGVLRWELPEEYGGTSVTDAEMLADYEELAAACLTTTFILTQRSGACQRIAGSENGEIKSVLLPALCSGESFATVGISHLTTSRQYLAKPAVTAVETESEFVLTGGVPWVTGASAAEHIITGGTLADGRQVLMAVPTSLAGVRVHEPMRLLALSASRTASISLEEVSVPRRYLLRGPVEQVMKQGRGGGAGSLMTSTLAAGLTRGILDRLSHEAERRPELLPIEQALAAEYRETVADLHATAEGRTTSGGFSPTAESVRQRANSLVLRTSQAFLAASKGAGYVTGHPAERAVREAMFFLVWSCPQPVVSAALREFACVIDEE